PSSRRVPAAATGARSYALAAPGDDAAHYVTRHVARDLRVLLQPAERVLVPLQPVGHVDPQRVAGGDELATASRPDAEQHLQLVRALSESGDALESPAEQPLVVRRYRDAAPCRQNGVEARDEAPAD